MSSSPSTRCRQPRLLGGDPTRTVLIGSAANATESMIGKPEVAYPELDELRTGRGGDADQAQPLRRRGGHHRATARLGNFGQHLPSRFRLPARRVANRRDGDRGGDPPQRCGGRGQPDRLRRREAVSADTIVATRTTRRFTPALPGSSPPGPTNSAPTSHSERRPARLPKCRTAGGTSTWSNEPPHWATHRSPGGRYQPSPPPRLQGRVRSRPPPDRPRGDRPITAGGAGAKASGPIRRSSVLGMKRKITISSRVGVPIMKVLASGKRLRGTVLDPSAAPRCSSSEQSTSSNRRSTPCWLVSLPGP